MAETAIQIINSTDFGTLGQMADIATSSGYVKVNKAQAMFIMLKGTELGISPLQALDGINIIQGKPTISPQLMLALINRSTELQDIKIDSKDTECVVTMIRKGRTSHTESFSLDDARKMGLTGKDNYIKQAKTMLKWRAVSACARIVFPDVIQGVYTPEEMGAEVLEDDAGDIVIIKAEEQAPAPQPQATVIAIPAESGNVIKDEPEHTQAPAPSTPQAYKLGDLYNAVLSDVYGKNSHHMTNSIKKMIDAGTLKPDMTLEQAVAAVKARKTDDNLPVTRPPETTAPKATEPPQPDKSRVHELNNEELLITRIEARADSAGWYGYGKFDGLEVRVNLFAPEDPKAITEKGHVWTGKNGAVAYPVILKDLRGQLRISDVVPKKGENPFGSKPADPQQLFNDLPAMSEAAQHQL